MDREKAKPNVSCFPGSNAKKHVKNWNKFGYESTHYYPFVWSITKDSKGPFCKDVDNNTFLDFTSHGGAAPLGYNNKYLMKKLSSFELIDPAKMYGQGLYYNSEEYPSSVDLMRKLVENNTYNLNQVFLSNSGAEAVENAIKISYNNRGSYGVCFMGSFHGRTLGALSLNRSKNVYRRNYPEISKIETTPYCRNVKCDTSTCDCGFFNNETSNLREKTIGKNSTIDSEDLSYIIIEPIQGEGGLNVPSEAFMNEIEEISKETGANIISDEVQTGVGRTGEMWGIDNYNLQPDIISSAKGLRVGATLSRKEIFPNEEARLSTTWGGGDILSSAVGALTIDIINEENLLKNANEKGKIIQEKIKDINSSCIKDVRGEGLLIGVELKSKKEKKNKINELTQKGLLLTSCGDKTLRIMPPLDIRDREIQIAIDLLEEVF